MNPMTVAPAEIALGSLGLHMGRLGIVRPRRRGLLSVADGDLDAAQAAELAEVSRTTIWRADPSELPYEEVGGGPNRRGDRRYRRADVERYRDGRRRSVKGRLTGVEARLDELAARVERLEQNHPGE